MSIMTDQSDTDIATDQIGAPLPEGDEFTLIRPTHLGQLDMEIGEKFKTDIDKIGLTTTADASGASRSNPVTLWLTPTGFDRDEVQSVIDAHVYSPTN